LHRKCLGGLGLALSLAACTSGVGGYGGDPVKPIVEPPPLEQVHVEASVPQRSEVVRVVLKDPTALPAVQIDAYRQKPGVVDILWVIDDSGSMHDQRTELTDSFDKFFLNLSASQTDFQMATISTNRDHGAQLHWASGSGQIITPSMGVDAGLADFTDQLDYPINSRVKWVQGLAMMKKFLSTPSLNQGFLRPGAALAVIAVSDGDDDSLGPVGYYARFLREVKGQGNENLVTFSTISGDLPSGCQPAIDAQFYGSRADAAVRFTGLARATNGVVGSICDTNFQDTLIQIAEALNTLRKIFPLSLAPDLGTLTVTVNGTPIPRDANTGWTYVASVNAIEFLGSYVPPPNADIRLQYAITSP
jgi:hypothetical protein